MSQKVTCPRCQTLLRSPRPITAGANLRCPDCRTSFTASPLAPATAGSILTSVPFLIAVVVSLLLGGSIITAALLLVNRRPEVVHEQPAEKKDDEALAKQRKELADREAALEKKKRDLEKKEHARLLAQAKTALKNGDHAGAEKLFRQALEIIPTDADTIEGLASAKAALVGAEQARKADDKHKAEVEQLLADGKKALADRKFALAVQRLEAAEKAAPTNRAVLDALNEARTALEADKTEQKKLADFRARMNAAKAAMLAEKFPEAVQEYLAALRLMPDDLEAQNGQKLALAKIAAAADREKRQKAFDGMADRGRKALLAKRYNEAIQSFTAALRLMPDDRDVKRDLQAARDGLNRAKKLNASLVARIDEAIAANRLADAKQLCLEAIGNWAEGPQAEKALRNVERLQDAQKTALAAYQARMQAAALAYGAGNYTLAVATYREAGRLLPVGVDPLIQAEYNRLLLRAREALEREVQRDLNRRLNVDANLKAGNQALATGNYSAAAGYFGKVLTFDPDNVLATAGLNKARYYLAINEGRQAMRLMRKGDAIAAFSRALDAAPGDPLATSLLQSAQRLPDGTTSPVRPRDKRKTR